MSYALGRWPGLVPGSYTCGCGNSGTVLVDDEAVAVCNKCAVPSDSILTSCGFRKMPHPLSVTFVPAPVGSPGGVDDRPRGKGKPQSKSDYEGPLRF